MSVREEDVRAMAAAVAQAMGVRTGRKQRRLSVVANTDDGEPARLNALQRDVLYARIADLSQQYALGWLIRQDTMHVHGIVECLPDADLVELLRRVECAVECVHEGVPFVEHGLVRGVTCNWVA